MLISYIVSRKILLGQYPFTELLEMVGPLHIGFPSSYLTLIVTQDTQPE